MTQDEGVSALRATAHPVRLRMLSLLTGTAMSAAEVARELGLTHANASYHLRVLADAGELEAAGEEKVRGGVAKRYRYPHERHGSQEQATSPGAPTTPDDRVAYARAVSRELQRRVVRLRPGRRGNASDLEGWVDPQAWDRAVGLLEEASMLLHDANRAPRSPGTVHVSFTTWGFEMHDDQQRDES